MYTCLSYGFDLKHYVWKWNKYKETQFSFEFQIDKFCNFNISHQTFEIPLKNDLSVEIHRFFMFVGVENVKLRSVDQDLE